MANTVILCEREEVTREIELLSEKTGARIVKNESEAEGMPLVFRVSLDRLSLEGCGQILTCDLSRMLKRLKKENLSSELLVRASRIKNKDGAPLALDATAGFGEDSLMLAAAGFDVKLYERNPFIAALLRDAMRQAEKSEELKDVISRMELLEEDSIEALKRLEKSPDVIYLDPMFPEKENSSLAKKKFQVLHLLEAPCSDGEELLCAAIEAKPHKIVIKRPLKGPYLGDKKPSFSMKGKAIRYDCIVLA